MSLNFICIEFRENLHCANVFLQFSDELSKTNFLKVNVQNNKIEIKQPCCCCISINLEDYFNLDARTLTNLTVEECNASFRLSIGNVHPTRENRQKLHTNKIDFAPLFDIGGKQSTTVHCNNCKAELMSTDTLVRMREFPSGAVDASEFFCHATADFKDILIPKICDLFYGLQFIVVNPELLDVTTKEKHGHLYCKRCLQYLGETILEEKAFKIWTDVIQQKKHLENGDETYKVVAKPITASQLLNKIVYDSSDVNESLHSIHFSKVLLEAKFPNRKSKFLMVQILEKNLKVLRNSFSLKHIDHSNHSFNNNSVTNVKLGIYKSFKVLYRFLEEPNDEETNVPALLQYWQQDLSIQTLRISMVSFSNLLQEFEENSKLVPEFYRYSRDNFKLSYIFYKD